MPRVKVFAVVGAAVVAIAAAVAVPIWASSDQESAASRNRHVEETMVSRLQPGRDFERLAQIIGSDKADWRVKLQSGNTIYQYDRTWEDIQLLANPAGEVLSVGIYAKDRAFHPVILPWQITLGKTHIKDVNDTVPGAAPNRANAYCGAHKAGYFESHEEASMAVGGLRVVVGLSDASSPDYNYNPGSGVDTNALCSLVAAMPSCQTQAPISPWDNELSAGYAQCVYSTPQALRVLESAVVSVVITTRGYTDISSDMLYPPDEVPYLDIPIGP